MAGTPEYGYTGWGMLFWDRKTESRILLEHTELLPDQSTMSLIPLADGKLLGGAGTRVGTGGEVKAAQAELYVIDMVTKKLTGIRRYFQGRRNIQSCVWGPKGWSLGWCHSRPTTPITWMK